MENKQEAIEIGMRTGAIARSLARRGLLVSAEQVLGGEVRTVARDVAVVPVASPSTAPPQGNITSDSGEEGRDNSVFFGADGWVVGVVGVVLGAGVVFLAVHLVNQRIAMRDMDEARRTRVAQLQAGAGGVVVDADDIDPGLPGDDVAMPHIHGDGLAPTEADAAMGVSVGAIVDNTTPHGEKRPASREIRQASVFAGGASDPTGILAVHHGGLGVGDDDPSGVMQTPSGPLSSDGARRAWGTSGSHDMESAAAISGQGNGLGVEVSGDGAFDAGPVPAGTGTPATTGGRGFAASRRGRTRGQVPGPLQIKTISVHSRDAAPPPGQEIQMDGLMGGLASPTLLAAMKQGQGGSFAGQAGAASRPGVFKSARLQQLVAKRFKGDGGAAHAAEPDWSPPTDADGRPERPPMQLASSDANENSQAFMSPLVAERPGAVRARTIGSSVGHRSAKLQIRATGLLQQRAGGSNPRSPETEDPLATPNPIRDVSAPPQLLRPHTFTPSTSTFQPTSSLGMSAAAATGHFRSPGVAARSSSTQRPRAQVNVRYVEQLGNGPSRGRRVQSDPVRDEDLPGSSLPMVPLTRRKAAQSRFGTAKLGSGGKIGGVAGFGDDGSPMGGGESSVFSFGAHQPSGGVTSGHDASPGRSTAASASRGKMYGVSGSTGPPLPEGGLGSDSDLSSDEEAGDFDTGSSGRGALPGKRRHRGARAAATADRARAPGPASQGRSPGGSLVLTPASGQQDLWRSPLQVGSGRAERQPGQQAPPRAPRGSLSRHPGAGGHGSFPGMHAVQKQARESSQNGASGSRRVSLPDGQQPGALASPMAAAVGVETPTGGAIVAPAQPTSTASRRAPTRVSSMGSYMLGGGAGGAIDGSLRQVRQARRVGSGLSSVPGTVASSGLHGRKSSSNSIRTTNAAGSGSKGSFIGMPDADGAGGMGEVAEIPGSASAGDGSVHHGGADGGVARGRAHTRDLSLDALDRSLDGNDLAASELKEGEELDLQ